MKIGLSLLRTTIGVLFVGHGTQKLFGWFGGHGPEGTAQFFESLGLRPGRRHATAAGAAEAGGGALLALGLLTPAAAASLIGVMFTAIRTVHFKNGPWSTNGGYEYNLALIAALTALAELGPGELSLDHALGMEVKGPLIGLLALGGGIAGATLMTQSSSAEPVGGAPIPGDPAAATESEPATVA
ncbi:MAG TPA: DoxX family protein, partial [Solirubrobacteraceae bacterium]|nr:DoxX family protein [Solirubrobacteraceae bacterium]